MSDTNRTYRIKTTAAAGGASNEYIYVDANLVQDYDTFEILSLSIDSVDTYRMHNANYGVVVGRVLANNGFGIPNAKISIFIAADNGDRADINSIYPFTSPSSKDSNGIRYNLLPDEKVGDCHQIVGTFPNKRYALDNDVILEVFDKYYKFTTRTNNSGDYLIMGVPVGAHTIHMDLDLSDCGILSQRPRDFVYKGYTIEQFENPNMFKEGTNYSELSQVFTQDRTVNVQPFWGNSALGEKLGLTRADIDVSFKFEPTCVFMGSIASDNASQGISKKCIPTDHMGDMDEMVTGEGTIEMIRKTPGGNIEEFQVKGNQLINSNGVWCYQIPMNLDYMMTDEYGNMVPTDDPEKGIPTRASVRFRISMQDFEENTDNYFRPKILVPNNPQNTKDGHEAYDYEFGSLTTDDSFRDLFWNNVYSVKSYIPRFQKSKVNGWKEEKFTGIKHCNYYGPNNPIPYNNLRIKLPFMFVVMCAVIKTFIHAVGIINGVVVSIGKLLSRICKKNSIFKKGYKYATGLTLTVLNEGLCPDLENWYFAPVHLNKKGKVNKNLWKGDYEAPNGYKQYNILDQTLDKLRNGGQDDDPKSIDDQNETEEALCLTVHTDYLLSCIEMSLAQEYRVLNFDFYNDWINGLIYVPRFMRYIRPKVKFLGITFARAKVKGCMDNSSIYSKTRRYTQQCAIGYTTYSVNGGKIYGTPKKTKKKTADLTNFHKKKGLSQRPIFGKNGGACHEHTTSKGQYVYYLKPCEWIEDGTISNIKANLFATDLILLGSLNDCDLYGIPQAFKHLSSSSYIMPTNLALTNMDTNGSLYANSGGTICSEAKGSDDEQTRSGALRVTTMDVSSGGLETELNFYGNSGGDYDTDYEDGEPSDTIAMTEAAGISWNWTGPGQGTPDTKNMYNPGGHFLGLSCVNSQTNLKTCVNLSRICEAGATMSQRKEDVSNYDAQNGVLTYTYTVPTGFISGDEIVDTEFRSMFATMNRKPLRATKRNSENLYNNYEFSFLRPSNFNGAFKYGASYTQYNQKIETVEEDLSAFHILSGNKRQDYDDRESTNTQTRTRETLSVDYYLFRFGLNRDDIKDLKMQNRQFLKTSDGYKYLPQYENSYYFYFGMKFGATAIDELNKQFFSQCETQKLVFSEPSVRANGENLNFCEAKGDIAVSIFNVDTPYEKIIWEKLGTNTEKHIKTRAESENDTEWAPKFISNRIVLDNLSFGEYIITVEDANGLSFSTNVKIGINLFSYDIEKYDYNDENSNNLRERGGYVVISNFSINGDSNAEGKIRLLRDGSTDDIASEENISQTVILSGQIVSSLENTYILQYKDGDNCEPIDVEKIHFESSSDIKLYMGFRDIVSASCTTDTVLGWDKNWWKREMSALTSNDAWFYKKCFFDTTLSSAETFNAHIFAVNGEKVIWGYPQKGDSTYNNMCISENYEDIPAGYSLDDEALLTPLYAGETNASKYYYCAVHKGNIIGCTSKCSWSSGTISNIEGNDNLDTFYESKAPCGYIYRSIDNDGDNYLQYGIYRSEHNFSGVGPDTPDGYFYPTFVFTTLKRPFYGSTSAVVWSDIKVGYEDDDEQDKVIFTNTTNGALIESVMLNGITRSGATSEDDTYVVISSEDNEEEIAEELVLEYGTTKPNPYTYISDLCGLSNSHPTNNKRIFAEFYPHSGISSINVNVMEYYPPEYSSYVNTLGVNGYSHAASVDEVFYDSLYFTVDNNGRFSGIGGEGNNDSNVTYSICSGFTGIKFTKKPITHRIPMTVSIFNLVFGGLFGYVDDDSDDENYANVIFESVRSGNYGMITCVPCRYNKNALYNVEGEETVAYVLLSADWGWKNYSAVVIYNYKTRSGIISAQTESVNSDVDLLLDVDNWDSSWQITPIQKVEINTAYSKGQNWARTIENNAVIINSDIYNSGACYYGIGKYIPDENDENGMVVHKIYPYINKKKIAGKNVTVNPQEVRVDYLRGTVELEISGDLNTGFEGTSNAVWVTFDYSPMLHKYFLSIDENYGEERTATVKIKQIKGGDAKVIVTQVAGRKRFTVNWNDSSGISHQLRIESQRGTLLNIDMIGLDPDIDIYLLDNEDDIEIRVYVDDTHKFTQNVHNGSYVVVTP